MCALFRHWNSGRRAGWHRWFQLALFSLIGDLTAQQLPPLLDPGIIKTSAVVERSTLDRTRGLLTSTVEIKIKNDSTQRIDGPLHAVLGFKDLEGEFVTSGVAAPGTQGGFGLAPWQTPFFDLTANVPAGGLLPGNEIAFTLVFTRDRALMVSYELEFAGLVNHAPDVDPGGPYSGSVDEPILFTATATDPDGHPVTFAWDFGDGASARSAEAAHAFATPGIHHLLLTAADDHGSVVERDVVVAVVPAGDFALARTRAVDGNGHPLAGTSVEETGPGGTRTLATEDSGFVSLGTVPGDYLWKFSAPGHRPVWRRATLAARVVRTLPSPWLAEESGRGVPVSVLEENVIASLDGAVHLTFPPGALDQTGEARVTILDGQTLSIPLPSGWSPLAAFHLALPGPPSAPGQARLRLVEAAAVGEFVNWIEFDSEVLRWRLIAVVAGDGTAQLPVEVPRGGTFAAVVRDEGTGAPLPVGVGEFLPAGTIQNLAAPVTATGAVNPAESTASLDGVEITARGTVDFTSATTLPSSSWFRLAAQETYALTDGSALRTPDYDASFYAYRRPAPPTGAHLRASFPLRPRLLFSAAELKEARLHVDVLPPLGADAGALSPVGGLLEDDDLQVVVPPNALSGFAAGELRALNVLGFSGLVGADQRVIRAFELNLGGLEPGALLAFALRGQVDPNTDFVLARLIRLASSSGLEPVQRYLSNATGALASVEPNTAPKLSGLTGAGQYLLVKLAAPQGLVTGLTRAGSLAGAPLANIGVRAGGQPWLSVSESNGSFSLLLPAGAGSLVASHSSDGDGGFAALTMPAALSAISQDLAIAAIGPRVASTSPAADATRVPVVTSIAVTFSERIAPATLGTDGLTLRAAGASSDIAASLTLDLSNRLVTLLPTNPLAPGTTFTLTVSAAIRDLQNLALEGPREFLFTTAAPAARGEGAQLTIFEPDAANLPAGLIIPGYNPAEKLSRVVAVGNAGTADPEVPVLLINETNGQTATVLSQPDGSFANFINAEPEDFIAAVFVNANGTRVRVPATRQLFDDGRVGLYQGGGILEAQSDGGPVQVIIEPKAIETRNVFKVETLGLQELLLALQGTVPQGARLLGGLKVKIDGEQVAAHGESNISVPLDPATLNLPPGQQPENGAFALAIAREVEGERVFQVVDRLKFKNGRLESNTFPFLGFLAAFAAEEVISAGLEVILSMLFIGDQNIIVSGKTVQAIPSANGGPVNLQPLPGAFVTAQKAALPNARQGRLQTGMLYATSGADGVFSLVLPENVADPLFNNHEDYALVATHPRFVGRVAEPVTLRVNEPLLERDLVFTTPVGGFSRFGPARLSISRLPRFPALDTPATLKIVARHGAEAPDVFVEVESVASRVPGVTVQTSDVTSTAGEEVVIGREKTKFFTIQSSKALDAVFRVRALADSNGQVFKTEEREFVRFGGSPTVGTNALTASDPNDTVGPVVIATFPPRGGTLGPGEKLTVVFNEPIDASATTEPNVVTMTPAPLGAPGLRLSADQQTLEIAPGGLTPGLDYTLTVSSTVKDLANPANPLDQEPGVSGAQTFSVVFRGAQLATTALAGINNGGGAVIHNNSIFALDRGTGTGELLVYELSTLLAPASGVPAAPAKRIPLIGFPRDLVVLPQWSFKRNLNSPTAETRDLLALVGGTAGTSSVDEGGNLTLHPQFLRVFDISDPLNPQVVVGALLSLRPNLITRISWHPPFLAYLENGVDAQQVGLIDLQEMLVGFNATPLELATFDEFVPGLDLNADGDYVDDGETLPIPPKDPTEFFGKSSSFVVSGTTQQIQDFSYERSLNYIAVTLSAGQRLGPTGQLLGPVLPPSYQILEFAGSVFTSPAGRLQFGAKARPKRVTTIFGQELVFGNQTELRNIALVTLAPDDDGKNKLAVIDLTQPSAPVLIGTPIEFAPELGVLQSATLRPDGLVALATTRDLLLLNPRLLSVAGAAAPAGGGAPPLHPAVVAVLPGAGSGNRTIGTAVTGLNAIALGGRNELVRTAPRLRFVSLPERATVLDPETVVDDVPAVKTALGQMRPTEHLAPARLRAEGGATASLKPPSPVVHYHVLVEAPGAAGSSFRVSLESLNRSGYPLKNKGRLFPPVRAMSEPALEQLKQKPRQDCDAAIRTLKAFRLSSEPKHPHFNLYVSEPFALTYERIKSADLDTLTADPKRAILWSGFYLRAGIDPAESGNLAIGAFSTTVDASEKVTRAGAAALALTLPANYVMGPNPPPVGGEVSLPATFGTVNATNGEFRHQTVDLVLPSRRMPIVFERSICAQDLHEGPFGRGWDSMYHQHLTELKPEVFPPGSVKPLVLRANMAKSVISAAGDVELNTGAGRVILFRNKGTVAPEEFSMDDLVLELGWHNAGGTFFLPDAQDKGVFDLLYRFRSGEFARLTPDGMQYRYSASGRLERLSDRYPKNFHVLEYSERGELRRIIDKSVEADRYLELGYYRLDADTLFTTTLDERTDKIFKAGKIARLRDYAGRDVLFEYSDDGILLSRKSPEASGANNGFVGRSVTGYQWSDDCSGNPQGVIAGNGAAQAGGGGNGGTPLFSASAPENADGTPIAASGTGAGGAVTITPPASNTAATVGTATTKITRSDGTSTDFKFDEFGYPAEIKAAGALAATATHTPKFNAFGLLETMTEPEGTKTTYTYDTANKALRSRANLLSIKIEPGARGGTPAPREATFTYNERYNLPSATHKNFNGKSITYTLRGDGRDVEKIVYGQAGTHDFKHNDFGQMESETTPEGTAIATTYESDTGFRDKVTRGGVVTTDFGYDSSIAGKLGVPTNVDLPRGDDITTAEYDARLLMTKMVRGGMTEQRGYDENGNLKTLTRTVGGGVSYREEREYTQISFLKKLTVKAVETDGSGATDLVTEFTPDAAHRVASVKLPGGETRSYGYDHLGNVITMSLGGYNEAYKRDLHGNLLEVRTKGELVRTMTYDGYDRAISIANKTGGADEITAIEYFGNGERKKITTIGPNGGAVMEMSVANVDELGRPMSETMVGDQTSGSQGFTYSVQNGLTTTTTGPRDTTTSKVDAAGRAVGFKNGLMDATMTPDGNGNIETIASTEGTEGTVYNTTFTFDGLDHRLTQRDDVGARFTFSPRLDGAVTQITDARSKVTVQKFTVLGEITQRTRPKLIEFNFTYDENRLPKSVTDSGGKGNTFDYDGTLRLERVGFRDSSATLLQSPDNRNLPRQSLVPGGNASTSYDLQGRMTSQNLTYNAGTAYKIDGIKYDALSRIRELNYGATGQHRATYGYDKLGPMTSASFDEPGGPFNLSTTIDRDGSRKSLVYHSGTTVFDDRESSGRLRTVSSTPGGEIWKATTFAAAQLPKDVQRAGGAITETNTYDLRKRLLSRRFVRQSDSALLAEVRYEYDPGDNQTARQFVHRHGRADVFEYDDANRLTRGELGVRPSISGAASRTAAGLNGGSGLKPGFFARDYSYDAGGLDLLEGSTLANPDNFGMQGQPAGLITGPILPAFAATITGHDAFLHAVTVDGFNRGAADPLGNVKKSRVLARRSGDIDPVMREAAFTYNALNQLTKVVIAADNLEIDYEYQLGGLLHHRTVKQGASTLSESAFVWHEGRLLEEHDLAGGSPQLRARYFYADEDTPVAAEIRQPGGGLERFHYLRDAQLSVMAVADDTGQVRERISYDPWGQPMIEKRDLAPPRISAVHRDANGDLLVQFTELVMPPLAGSSAGTALITATQSVSGVLTVTSGGPIPGQLTYEEALAGFPFGTVLRFSPGGALSDSLSITTAAGRLVDEWGNANDTETRAFTLSGAQGSLLFQGPAAGSTGPGRTARSAIGSPILFHGQLYDFDAGLSYMRARFYDPFTGQFLQRDPEQYGDSVNLYAAFLQNPAGVRDPMGTSVKRAVEELLELLGKEGAEEITEKLSKQELAQLRRSAAQSAREQAARKRTLGAAAQRHGSRALAANADGVGAAGARAAPVGGARQAAGTEGTQVLDIHARPTQILSPLETAGRSSMRLANGAEVEVIDMVWRTPGGRPGMLVKTSDGWQPFYLTSGTNRPHLVAADSGHPWLPFEGYDVLRHKGKDIVGWLNKGRHPHAYPKDNLLHGYSSPEQKLVSDALQKRFGVLGNDAQLNDLVLGSTTLDANAVNRALFNLGARPVPNMQRF